MSGWRLENLAVTRFSGLAPRVFMPTGAGDLLINCSPPDSGSARLLLRRQRAVHCRAEPTTRKLRELIRSGAVMDSVSECRGLSSCDTLSENLKNLHDGSDLFRRGHR